MSYPDQSLTSLEKIRVKVRKLTRSLSENHLSTASLNDFINSFILFDFPQLIDAEQLETKFTFFTKPYICNYFTNTETITDQFYNFKNIVLEVKPQAFLTGSEIFFYKNERDFRLNNEPSSAVKETTNTGNGVIFAFSGTLSAYPVVAGQVSFTSIDAYNKALVVEDVPDDDGLTGVLYNFDYSPASGTINYVTGAYTLEFLTAPAASAPIYSETTSYVPSKPSAILYTGNELRLWPVPDKSYRVELTVKRRPTELLDDEDSPVPEIAAWWEFIAYGASKKIFEDRGDMKSLEIIMNEFNRQEELIEKRKLIALAGRRAPTIYSV